MIYTATEDISTIYTAIDDFVDYLQQVLQYTPSVYLYGSVMTDDFTPNSDVNLLVVTPSQLTDVQTQRLTTARQFLAEVRETNNFLRINGAIICQADFVSGKAKGNVLYYAKGKQYVDDVYPLTTLDKLTLKTQSKLLVGDDVLAQIDMPTRAQIFAECKRVVQSVSTLGKADGSAFAYECMFWLTRALYTVATNEVASKSDSMLWAMEQGYVAEKAAMQCLTYHVTNTKQYNDRMKQNLSSKYWQAQIDKLVSKANEIVSKPDSFVPTVEVFYNGDQDEPRKTGKLTWKRR